LPVASRSMPVTRNDFTLSYCDFDISSPDQKNSALCSIACAC
jgi:hypothetical protein